MPKRTKRSVFVYRCNVVPGGIIVPVNQASAVFRTPAMLMDYSAMATHPGWTRSDRAPDVAWYVWSERKRASRCVGGLFDAAASEVRHGDR